MFNNNPVLLPKIYSLFVFYKLFKINIMCKIFKCVVICCATVFFFACNSEVDLSLDQCVGQEIEFLAIDDVTFVSMQQAIDLAEAFFGVQSTLRSANAQKRIISTVNI